MAQFAVRNYGDEAHRQNHVQEPRRKVQPFEPRDTQAAKDLG